jgi:adenylate isopentenyltransferase (cytokinin synthase)
MVGASLVKEPKEYFDTMSIHKIGSETMLAKATSVWELREYFGGRRSLSDSIDEMKANTKTLAKAQTTKIHHIVGVWS